MHFSIVEEIIPELKNTTKDVVVIGYNSCPYSDQAKRLICKTPKFKDKSVFIGFERDHTIKQFKEETKYHGTFPIVFVRDTVSSKMKHIGGAHEFGNYLSGS